MNCAKCGGTEIRRIYHTRGRSYSGWKGCGAYDHNDMDGEHIHYHCQSCQYDWTGPTLDARPREEG